MKAVMLVIAALAISRSNARADALFPENNPYTCIREAKASRASDQQRRSDLSACMAQVDDPLTAVQALNNSGFYISVISAHELERMVNSGQHEKARELLIRMIMTVYQ